MNPIPQFSEWFEEAKANKTIAEPTAMCLATVGRDGAPSARMVLLKSVDERGFVFYTNLESRKSSEIEGNPNVALCFHWMPLEKQVRVEGEIEAVAPEEADAYFASRPRDSQIGAWASKQSREIEHTGDLMKAIAFYAAKFAGRDVPRPTHWSGWRVVPKRIEFWKQGAFRIHDREVFIREGQWWKILKLYP